MGGAGSFEFQGASGVQAAAKMAAERSSTCSVRVCERVDGDSPASVRLPSGTDGSCRHHRNKRLDSQPQNFFSLSFASPHAPSTEPVV